MSFSRSAPHSPSAIIGGDPVSGGTGAPGGGPMRAAVWTAWGLDPAWEQQRLAPVAADLLPGLQSSDEAPASLRDVLSDPDWDILLLGDAEANPIATAYGPEGAYGVQRGRGGIEELDKIVRARPLDAVVVVAAGLSPGRLLQLMRIGAFDVIDPADSPARVSHVLARAAALTQARRSHTEQEKLRVISQLAVSVNHEVNNPLTGIMGTAELMLMDNKNLDDKLRRDVQMIIEQCQRIREVTVRLKNLNHLRTIPYGMHDQMLDLVGDMPPIITHEPTGIADNQFLPVPRLLVVDDNPLILDLVVRLFDQRFQIDAANCASEALIRLERADYDLAILDLILPEMNGLELFRAMRRIRPLQKVIIATAHQGDARVEQAIVEGASGYIYKPFQLEDLEEAIARALASRGK